MNKEDDKEFKSRAQLMGELIRQEELKMLKMGQEFRKQEQAAWDATKAILAKVGVKR